jgi:catechol 2,3-dioxygenase-like lactoylglutathione lyase family enzyme
MMSSLKHIALFVPNLRAAEQYYQTVFDMKLIGREALLKDGFWYTLPFDKGWDDAEAAGIGLGMLALQKDKFVLALFKAEFPHGQVYAIGLTMPAEEIARIRVRLQEDVEIGTDEPESLEFRDPYQIIWQISVTDEFSTAGVFANRWLQL